MKQSRLASVVAIPVALTLAVDVFACDPSTVCEYNDPGSYSYQPPDGSWVQNADGSWSNNFPMIFNAPSPAALQGAITGASQFSSTELSVHGTGVTATEAGEYLNGIYFADGSPDTTPFPSCLQPGTYGCAGGGVVQINPTAVNAGTPYATTVHEICHLTVSAFFPDANVSSGGQVDYYGPGHGVDWYNCSVGHI